MQRNERWRVSVKVRNCINIVISRDDRSMTKYLALISESLCPPGNVPTTRCDKFLEAVLWRDTNEAEVNVRNLICQLGFGH